MRIDPKTNLLRSFRGDRTDYLLLAGEGIDNGLDAGAQRVSVTVSKHLISIDDNGCGITRDRIESLFSLGDHGRMSTTALGRFGIGIKAQAMNAADIMRVVSTSREGRVLAEVDWRAVLRSGVWEVADPKWQPSAVGAPTGTKIEIADLRHPPKIDDEKFLCDLAEIFYPAIKHGCQIIFNGLLTPVLGDPAMTDIIDKTLELSSGRSAHVRAGLLSISSRLNQVHVGYMHRVIKPRSSVGCGSYGGLTKMFARVQLSGPWHFAKYKNDLTDEGERTELEEALEGAMRPLLEKCNSSAVEAKIDTVLCLINDKLPTEIATARPQKKNPQDRKGKKANKNGAVEPEKSIAGGPARSRRPLKDRLIITFDGIAEQDGIGSFQAGGPNRPHRVNLSKDDDFISKMLVERDSDLIAECLVAIAILIFEEGSKREAQLELDLEPFGVRAGRLLKMQRAA